MSVGLEKVGLTASPRLAPFETRLCIMNGDSGNGSGASGGDRVESKASCATFLLAKLRSDDFAQRYKSLATKLSRDNGECEEEVAAAAAAPAGPEHIWESLERIGGWLQSYPNDRLLLTWNGGKDCTVLFHLVRMAVALQREQGEKDEKQRQQQQQQQSDEDGEFGQIQGLWLRSSEVFPELERFIEETADLHGLKMLVCNVDEEEPAPPSSSPSPPPPPPPVEGLQLLLPPAAVVAVPKARKPDYRRALETLQRRRPFSAVFMAQRRSDPGCGSLELCAPSDVDRGWPEFDRLNPLLDWSYSEIWVFLQAFEIPFCHLYNLGYSSLGSSPVDTRKNPWLRSEDGSYLPAWRLAEQERERSCRETDGEGGDLQ